MLERRDPGSLAGERAGPGRADMDGRELAAHERGSLAVEGVALGQHLGGQPLLAHLERRRAGSPRRRPGAGALR